MMFRILFYILSVITFALPTQAEEAIGLGGVSDDLYLFGEVVTVKDNVKGDVRILAKTLTLEDITVGGDISLAGREIRIKGKVNDDAHILGETVTFDGQIGGDMMMAGREVTTTDNAIFNGTARIAGERVSLGGHYKKAVQVTGKKLYLSGVFDTDIQIDSEELVVQKEARIAGKLIYRGKYAPVIDDRSMIKGGYTHEVPEVFEKVEKAARATKLGGIILLIMWPTLAGLFLVLVMRRTADTGLRLLRRRFWHNVGFGLAGLLGIPLVAALLMISVVGLPFGVSLFASYPVSLLLGSAMGALYLGDRIWKIFGKVYTTVWGHLLLLLTGVAGLAVVGQIPYLGGLFVLVVIISGVGGMMQFRLKLMTQKIDVK